MESEFEEGDDADGLDQSNDYSGRNTNTGEWQTISRGSKKRKELEPDEERREEGKGNEIKVIVRL